MSCGCYFDTFHPTKHCCRASNLTINPAHCKKVLRNILRKTKTSPRCGLSSWLRSQLVSPNQGWPREFTVNIERTPQRNYAHNPMCHNYQSCTRGNYTKLEKWFWHYGWLGACGIRPSFASYYLKAYKICKQCITIQHN